MFTMEGLKIFLESSTIHGLTYISSTTKYAKLFWLLVVIGGFSCALYLINESFSSWAKYPVTTTIETLPIKNITFPKVTVCPPKYTYTEMNYDLTISQNITLSDEKRRNLYKYALRLIDNYTCYMDKLNMLHEDYRFYNWYYQMTGISKPTINEDNGDIQFGVETSAIYGTINTQYFGETFQKEKVQNNFGFWVDVFVPESIRMDKNVTLHFLVEKQSIQGLANKSDEVYLMSMDEGGVDFPRSELSYVYRNFTPPRFDRRFGLIHRRISSSDMDALIMDRMPGFKFNWWYTGNQVSPEPIFYHEDVKLLYIEFVKKVTHSI